MWNFFKSKSVETVPTSYALDANIILKKEKDTSAFRVGMWVIYDNKIGILHKKVNNDIEVHLVNQDTGETTLIVNTQLNAIRQATYSEIPYCRKINFPVEIAKEYGYGP